MSSRRGLSLTEVLIAIFVMAIGMISLLAMFPIGMFNLAQAIRDNRLAVAAANAEAMIEAFNIRADPNVLATANVLGATVNPNSNQSPPVFIDPLGVSLGQTTPIGAAAGPVTFVRLPWGNQQAIGVPRTTLSFAPSYPLARRWFVQEDDITFRGDGLPVGAAAGQPIERERRYSWAYLWRRPRFGDASIADVTIVLFSGRQTAGFALGGEDRVTGPGSANGQCFTVGSRRATFVVNPGGGQPIALRTGYWVLDATVIPGTAGNGFNDALMNGFFYRIVAVGDPYPGGTGELLQDVELDRPAKADGYVGVFLLGIVDVIEKNQGQMPN